MSCVICKGPLSNLQPSVVLEGFLSAAVIARCTNCGWVCGKSVLLIDLIEGARKLEKGT